MTNTLLASQTSTNNAYGNTDSFSIIGQQFESGHSLIGKTVYSVTLSMARSSITSDQLFLRIYNSDGSVKSTIATKLVSELPSSYGDVTFTSSSGTTIATDDIIGLDWSSPTSQCVLMQVNSDTESNTSMHGYHVSNGQWQDSTYDLYFKIYGSESGGSGGGGEEDPPTMYSSSGAQMHNESQALHIFKHQRDWF